MSDPRHDLPMHEAQHSFDVVLRGYDRSQVADTIERLEADFRIALADRDAAVARSADLAGQLSAMHGEIESLRPGRWKAEVVSSQARVPVAMAGS